MTSWLAKIVGDHRRSGLLVDANILLLYTIGSYQLQLIEKFKRTRQFTEADFHLLEAIWSEFEHIYTTPFILAEVSNLSSQLPHNFELDYRRRFGTIIEVLREQYVPSRVLAQGTSFLRFGLTDTSIEQLAAQQILVLTDDFRLSQRLAAAGIEAINFNHLRDLS